MEICLSSNLQPAIQRDYFAVVRLAMTGWVVQLLFVSSFGGNVEMAVACRACEVLTHE